MDTLTYDILMYVFTYIQGAFQSKQYKVNSSVNLLVRICYPLSTSSKNFMTFHLLEVKLLRFKCRVYLNNLHSKKFKFAKHTIFKFI